MPDLRPVFFVIGLLVASLGAAMFVPMIVDLAYGDRSWQAFAISGIFTMLFGGVMALAAYSPQRNLRARGAFILTTLSWVALSAFAALPLWLSPIGVPAIDAMFESVSGITTTGSTVFTGLDDMPKGVLLWRAILQWIGGVGIIVTAMAILPMLKVGGMQLFRLESSDMGEKILPKAASIAAGIGYIYVFLTFLCALGYLWTGMNGFDAVAHAMTTIATGGYSTSDASMGGFMDNGADLVGITFMLAGALPFGMYLMASRGNFRGALTDPQMRAFFAVVSLLIATLTLFLWISSEIGRIEGLRLAAFNTISIITGTGYATADYNSWGPFAVAMFFAFMFIGGCAGSTACSVKIFRYQVAFEGLRAYLFKMPRRHAVSPMRYNNAPLPESVVYSVMGFLFLFLTCFAISAVALSMTGLDPVTAWSAAGTSIANVGPGLGDIIGPVGNFQSLPASSKWILMFNMLLGRLEIVTALVLLTPSFWRS
ncbi:TrkH family potassium uptake protein [Robiginitomaculum antarcticum]|uniref:TrkH family potassium uptake protein n=1 Tax=Robiginitomaculum antarcticum TaxID=437507 RepID=UPI0003794719|nr:TrkH family potassium uptake protein [Robiginitomaculum antarcticum]